MRSVRGKSRYDSLVVTVSRQRATALVRLLQAMAAWAAAILVAVGISRLPSRGETHEAPTEQPHGPSAASITYPRLRNLVIFTLLLGFGLWLFIRFAAETIQAITILAMSLLLATALRPTVDRMSSFRWPVVNRTMPRALAILLIYLLLVVIVVGIAFLLVPQVIFEVRQFTVNIPGYVDYIRDSLQGLGRYPFVPDIGSLQEQLAGQLINNVLQAIDILFFALRVVLSALSFLVVLVITFFFIMDAQMLYDHLLSLVPPSRRESVRDMTAEMGRKVEGWLKGVFLLSAFIGVATAFGMWAIGMPFPFLLGLAAGLFELVPIVGAYLGAAPAVIVACFQPLWMLAAVIVFFFVLQQIENNVLAPSIMGREVEMPPLLAITALLLGAAVYGIIGALLALPVAAVFQVLWVRLVVPEIRRGYGERE